MAEDLSRRSFLKTGAAFVAAGAAASLVGCSENSQAAPKGEQIAWDAETDIVIVGSGFAGLSAAMCAKTEFPDVEFALVDAAPLDCIGGNSRVCGQVFTTMDDVEGAVQYLNMLNGGEGIVEPELVKAWAERTVEIADWVKGLGADISLLEMPQPWNGGIEFPEYRGSDHVTTYACEGVIDTERESTDGVICGIFYHWAYERSKELGIEVQTDTRITDFVLDEATREIRGVQTEDGRTYKARKGVILTCGGFENDLNMLRQYIPLPNTEVYPSGTWYNRGDGVRMTMALGAQMWHMNNFASFSWNGYLTKDRDWMMTGSTNRNLKDFVFIGPRGRRFMYEERCNFMRHGKSTWFGGIYSLMPICTPAWMVFGQDKFDEDNPVLNDGSDLSGKEEFKLAGDGTNESALEQGIIVKADTLEELAEKMGLDELWVENFVDEMTKYNEYAAANDDRDYQRGTYFFDDGCPIRKEIKEFELSPINPPYYAVQLVPKLLNTQGGPKRNEKCEVLDMEENPIPRLYTAGELGAIYASDYNGGGNVCEDWTTGRDAMRQCAVLESWEAGE